MKTLPLWASVLGFIRFRNWIQFYAYNNFLYICAIVIPSLPSTPLPAPSHLNNKHYLVNIPKGALFAILASKNLHLSTQETRMFLSIQRMVRFVILVCFRPFYYIYCIKLAYPFLGNIAYTIVIFIWPTHKYFITSIAQLLPYRWSPGFILKD